jgi:hypothetical protein
LQYRYPRIVNNNLCGYREKDEEYEGCILAHLRQISLYDSPEEMVRFLELMLLEPYNTHISLIATDLCTGRRLK